MGPAFLLGRSKQVFYIEVIICAFSGSNISCVKINTVRADANGVARRRLSARRNREANMKEQKTYYMCDPNKNVNCKKTACKHNPNARQHNCQMTTHKEFSIDGVPIKMPLTHRAE